MFASYEGLRLPRETPIITSVPTLAMRGNGTGFANLTGYLAGQGIGNIYAPDGVTPLNPAAVAISPIAANTLKYLMPAPNYGSADS